MSRRLVRRYRGDSGGRIEHTMSQVIFETPEEVATDELPGSLRSRSARVSSDREADRGGGAPGSLLARHSQDRTGSLRLAPDRPRAAADEGLAHGTGAEQLFGWQHRIVHRLPVQQLRPAAPDGLAVASPTIDRTPAIAAKAMHQSRRWRQTVMIAPGKLPSFPPALDSRSFAGRVKGGFSLTFSEGRCSENRDDRDISPNRLQEVGR
jgi:hypothetical protein